MDALSLLARAQAAYSDQDYAEALSVIATAEVEGKACAETLLLKAACIQLSCETDFPVERAFDVYRSLLDVRPNDSRALIEAGYFCLNVQNDPKQAVEFFTKAIAGCSDLFNEAMVGMLKAKLELGLPNDEAQNQIHDHVEALEQTIQARISSRQ